MRPHSTTITVPCFICGAPVKEHASHADRRQRYFCSKACRQTPCVPIECVVCHQPFLAKAQAAGRDRFCSRPCFLAYSRQEQLHKKSPHIERTCNRCGKVFSVRRSIGDKQIYCSRACSHVGTAPKHQGSKNPNWKPNVLCTCEYCGIEFLTYPCRVPRRKYCCRQHRILGNLQRLASGARTELEIAMANALETANIEYQEQVIMFDKFLVDFRIIGYNLIVQCDGQYWHDRPRVRARDKGQDRYFKKAGFTVLRFTDDDILNHMDNCIAQVIMFIRRHPQLTLFL